ncbi:hypothetical protein COX85_03375 [Candidatus Micrarchaeota archaeon CG_4_10_14_0_2_um_filter_55_9]|nr:MAG: hypothetical protein AUJ15_01625 [Candidatus Micrarchaeota archaeon CG1_02_55_41]PIO02532.1 MAG: hypothetical protein COT57_03450 [Candidatus Micrarchaeota archaeon CG09_land_8_20_14_0_10_55_25]PIZ91539.1 MAG: hypothetical protein COX85_03375 [Candidatus Micrarchaeota archaeon CG_4_10_14_0_2_um_filter_55_9]PJD01518.1 MAG: hypothetical protein COU38_00495 [Candidatus Micrarchaeota archaeon CG10_big_fil_rev_8_21_14_0_10_54_18]
MIEVMELGLVKSKNHERKTRRSRSTKRRRQSVFVSEDTCGSGFESKPFLWERKRFIGKKPRVSFDEPFLYKEKVRGNPRGPIFNFQAKQ